MAVVDLSVPQRWELYRVLSEPIRLRLLALAGQEELSIGELADLLGEGQPNVSRHAGALRQAGLLRDRREGTRTLVRAASEAASDAVVADAMASGRALCEADGSLARIVEVLRVREAAAHEFFARPGKARVDAMPAEVGAYLAAFGWLLPRRALALDAGTGDGRLLEVLAPTYERVVAVDRSGAQLTRARERVAGRGFANVTFMQGELDSRELRRAVRGGADAVFASRVLHHAPRPAVVVAHLASLCAPGGVLVVLDYQKHDDESMREQADAWLGFEAAELRRFARAAGLQDPRVTPIPKSLCGDGADKHLQWQVLVARSPRKPSTITSAAAPRRGVRIGVTKQDKRNEHG
ncbi:MAG: metalloregulator ArsR/SmtB family transcription factor [Myxococcota bacterium]|nr:metalloregulator ArsR/SmtB family transcription factor [Myxococcota bacterium]